MASQTLPDARRVLTTLVATAGLLGVGAAFAGSHFEMTTPNPFAGGKQNLGTPLQFEAAAAEAPVANSLVLFSRCRRAPFNANVGLYAPLMAPEFDAIVDDTTFVLVDGTLCYNPQNEQNIVINPADSQNIITASNEYRADVHAVYFSKDGGHSWTNLFLPGWTGSSGGRGVFGHLSSCGDPVLAFAPDGKRVYYAGLVCNFFGASPKQLLSGVAVASSADGGATWSRPVMVHFEATGNFLNDKEWITVAPDGTVYVTWSLFTRTGASPIVLSKSTDGGATWSEFVKVSDPAHPFNQGSQPQVAADGTLFVAYEGGTPSTGFQGDAVIVARSTNGGVSFTNAEITRVFDDANCYPLQIGAQGRQTLTHEQFRLSALPAFAIDRTNGRLAIVWNDDRANPSCGFEHPNKALIGATQNQIQLITSSDGVTWSAPRTLTSSDTFDKAYPSVAANAGRILVGYYTRKFSPVPTRDDASCGLAALDTVTGAVVQIGLDPVCLDYATRSSSDDFASEKRVSRQSSNPYMEFAGAFIGDYTGAALDANGNGVVVWTDDRGNPGITSPNQDALVATGQ